MLKKIVLGICIVLASFLFSINVHAETAQQIAEGDISKPEFTININSIAPGGDHRALKGDSTDETVNNVLQVIIKNLIVVFGVLSLLVMTIGGGYMIFHAGEESLLSRGKSIFIYGLVSLAVALSAGIIVKIVTYLLY